MLYFVVLSSSVMEGDIQSSEEINAVTKEATSEEEDIPDVAGDPNLDIPAVMEDQVVDGPNELGDMTENGADTHDQGTSPLPAEIADNTSVKDDHDEIYDETHDENSKEEDGKMSC